MKTDRVDLLLAGHVTIDTIVAEGQETLAPGGAVYYGSWPASLFDIRVGVVTKLAAQDMHILDELRAAGITVYALDGVRTTRIRTTPKSTDFERRSFVVESQAGPFRAADFEGLGARLILACPLMVGEMPLEVLAELSKEADLALDVQGFVRRPEGRELKSGAWGDMREGLSLVKFLKVDKREVEILTGQPDMAAGIERLAALGPQEILCTHSEGISLWAGGKLTSANFTCSNTSGRTGRGDTAFASYLAARLSQDPEESLATACRLTSRKLERPGPLKHMGSGLVI